MAHDTDNVAKVVGYGRRAGVPVVFRGGARASTARARATASSSMSAVISAASRIEDGGRLVRVRPGTLLGHANRVLVPTGASSAPTPPAPTLRPSAA